MNSSSLFKSVGDLYELLLIPGLSREGRANRQADTKPAGTVMVG